MLVDPPYSTFEEKYLTHQAQVAWTSLVADLETPVSAMLKIAEGYKDLHSLVFAFFGQDKSKYGFPKNDQALFYTLFYVPYYTRST